MANQDVRVSALNSTSTLSTDDLSLETVVDELSVTGYTSKKITEGAKASQYMESFTFSNLQTNAKTIVGAINEAAQSGGGGGSADLFLITHSTGSTVDKTYAEIAAAVASNKIIYLKHANKMYPCSEASGTSLFFDELGIYDSNQPTVGFERYEIRLNSTAQTATFNANAVQSAVAFDELTETLTAGTTSVSFSGQGAYSGKELSDDMTVEFFCDVFGLNPTAAAWSVDSVTGDDVLTLTFEAQASDVSVKVRFY